jgi:hypothetical protein
MRIQSAATPIWRVLRIIGAALLISCLCTVGFCHQASAYQESKSQDDLSAESFVSLRDRRDDLTKQIEDAEKNLKDLQTAEYWLGQEKAAKDELEKKEKSRRLTPDERTVLEKKMADARSSSGTNSTLEDVSTQIKLKPNELSALRKRRDSIDAEMSRRIDLETPKQKFKTNMSIVFALLVGVVILGFFVIAFRDETVRKEIFSGASGIQFVTLFSLVIAIILFGITGILEGKELSALLGGLSGYILGRGSSTSGNGRSPATQSEQGGAENT